MSRTKKTRKFAQVKKIINPNDQRLKQNKPAPESKPDKLTAVQRHQQVASSLFFRFNSALVPPYQILLDTNFINFSIQNKLDISKSLLDCLYAKCIVNITDCVYAELEKLGAVFKVALKVARDPRFNRLKCMHSGTYADDCLVQRVTQHRCFIVATCDKGLKKRIRAIPGVPILSIVARKYAVERLPEVEALH